MHKFCDNFDLVKYQFLKLETADITLTWLDQLLKFVNLDPAFNLLETSSLLPA